MFISLMMCNSSTSCSSKGETFTQLINSLIPLIWSIHLLFDHIAPVFKEQRHKCSVWTDNVFIWSRIKCSFGFNMLDNGNWAFNITTFVKWTLQLMKWIKNMISCFLSNIRCFVQQSSPSEHCGPFQAFHNHNFMDNHVIICPEASF